MKWENRRESTNVEYDCLGVRTTNYDLAKSCWADLDQQRENFVTAALKANAPSEEFANNVFNTKLKQLIVQNGLTGSATQSEAQGMLANFEIEDAVEMDARLTGLKSATHAVFNELADKHRQPDERVQAPHQGPKPSGER